jgi:ankyrin repeat protein
LGLEYLLFVFVFNMSLIAKHKSLGILVSILVLGAREMGGIVRTTFTPQDHKANSALMVAATRGHAATVALLLAARPPAAVDLPRDDGATPLMMACFEGHTEAVRALLKGRPDVNRQVRCVACHAWGAIINMCFTAVFGGSILRPGHSYLAHSHPHARDDRPPILTH